MTLRFLYYLLLISTILPFQVDGQELNFQHLTVKEGMPSNPTGHVCFDSTGFIWMGTNDGLINYDGLTIRQYTRESNPGLLRNEIGSIFCDSRNRLWVCTNYGITQVDEQRKLNYISIHDSLDRTNIDYCFEVKGLGMVAVSRSNSYLLREHETKWEKFTWLDSLRKGRNTMRYSRYDDRSYLFFIGNRLLLADFKNQELIFDVEVKDGVSAVKLNEQQVIALTNNSISLHIIDVPQKKVIRKITDIRDQHNRKIEAAGYNIIVAADGIVYFTTWGDGLIRFNVQANEFRSYLHDPLDDRSIGADNLRWVFVNKKGYMAVSSMNGLNLTHTGYGSARHVERFLGNDRVIYDGSVTGIAETDNGTLWLKTFTGVLTWHPETGAVKTIRTELTKTNLGHPGTIARDNKGRLWIGSDVFKISIYESSGRLLKELDSRTAGLPSQNTRVIRQLHDGNMLFGSEDGMFLVNPQDYSIDTFSQHPELRKLRHDRIVDLMVDGQKLWVASSPSGAAYCYDFSTKQMKKWTTANGLSSNRVYCLGKDHIGNVYIGTYDGLNIVSPAGTLKVINRNNGLRHTRVENLVTDTRGFLWVTNFNSLFRYDPGSGQMVYFDERNGIPNAGFSVATNLVSKNGVLYIGNYDGLLVLDPTQLQTNHEKPRILLQRLLSDGTIQPILNGQDLNLHHDAGKVDLYFLSDELIGQNRYYFRYRLDGVDTGWSVPTKNHYVSYNLRPGKYKFIIQASSNELEWQETHTQFKITVSPPFWQTLWFRGLVIILLLSTIYILFKRREKSIKAKAAIQQQMAELEGKALRAQMNPHFIFNSLNAIQELVVTENYQASYEYLSKFSRLLRLVLNNSEKNLIPLSSEIEMNKLYLDLESLRFKQSFFYTIKLDENIDPESTLFPSLLLQPFIENAIWHGLMHKQDDKQLLVNFSIHDDDIVCTIEDNGIGRKQSAAIKAQKLGARHFDSKGSVLASQRLATLRKMGMQHANVEIVDLENPGGEATGTKVIITVPLIDE